MFEDLYKGASETIMKRYKHISQQQDLENLMNIELHQKLKKVIDAAYKDEFKHLSMSVYRCELGIANY